MSEHGMSRELKIFTVQLTVSFRLMSLTPRVFGNDSVIRDVLYQSQLGQNSRFCPVLMLVKKGR